jgi:hypothetical protein
VAGSIPEPAEIARRLLDQEMGDLQDPAQVAEAGERICRKLHGQIAPLIGPRGFQAMVDYAMRGVAAQHPLLKEVQTGIGDDPCLKGLAEKARDSDPAQVSEALLAFFASFLTLVLRLFGESLGLSLLRSVLPEL